MKRFRQYRTTQKVRDQYADVPPIQAQDFIYPYFVEEGEGIKTEIPSMEDVYRFSIDTLLEDIEDKKFFYNHLQLLEHDILFGYLILHKMKYLNN